jgi:hypothetical protein
MTAPAGICPFFTVAGHRRCLWMKPPFPSGRGNPVRAVSIRSFQEKLRQTKSAGRPRDISRAFFKPANAVLRDNESLLEPIEAGLAPRAATSEPFATVRRRNLMWPMIAECSCRDRGISNHSECAEDRSPWSWEPAWTSKRFLPTVESERDCCFWPPFWANRSVQPRTFE